MVWYHVKYRIILEISNISIKCSCQIQMAPALNRFTTALPFRGQFNSNLKLFVPQTGVRFLIGRKKLSLVFSRQIRQL